jgi:hypothetical protein
VGLQVVPARIEDVGVLDLRQIYQDTFRLIDLDGIFVLAALTTMVPELAREIGRASEEAGLTTEDLLKTLREERERYYQENYASGESK